MASPISYSEYPGFKTGLLQSILASITTSRHKRCCVADPNGMSHPIVMGKRIVGRPRIVTVGQSGLESGGGGFHCCCCTCCTCINLQFLRTVEGRLKVCEVVSCRPSGTEVNAAGITTLTTCLLEKLMVARPIKILSKPPTFITPKCSFLLGARTSPLQSPV